MQQINQISYTQLKEWQQEQKPFILIDVREPSEHKAFNIGGRLLPFSEFSVSDYQFEKDIPVVIYCKKGIRSTLVIQRLIGRIDCSNFYNLTNGIVK